MVAPKIAYRRELGSFTSQQAQLQGQSAAATANLHTDALRVLNNRVYAALATDTGNVASAAYATLLTANITTVLAAGYLLITTSVSGAQITNTATPAIQILVDGVIRKGCYQVTALNSGFSLAMVLRVAVTRGAHTVLLQYRTSADSIRISAATIVEEHAHLLVQEQT